MTPMTNINDGSRRDMFQLILDAENRDFEDDEHILEAAEAVRRSGLQHSVGWAGRFLRDVEEAFGGDD